MSTIPDFECMDAKVRCGLAAADAMAGSVAVMQGDRTRVFVHGEAQPGRVVQPSTPFHICSCSKTFTAAIFSRLVQDGVVAWDDRIHPVLPELAFIDPWVSHHCTFRDLATLRVGLSRTGIAEWGIRQDLSREARIGRTRHMSFAAPFRDRFSYSNLCYIALALAAERLGGKPYSTLVREILCRPLGMADSGSIGFGIMPDSDAALPGLRQGKMPVRVRDLTGPNSEGSARIYLSGRDAIAWMHFLLAGLRGSDVGPLSAPTLKNMATPHTLVRDPDVRMTLDDGAPCAYGMGFIVSRWKGGPLLRHGGGGRGWRHAMALAPDARAGVMVMTAAESPVIDALAMQLLEAVTGSDMHDWSAPFTRAAEASADADRLTIEASFPVECGVSTRHPVEGHYGNPLTGDVRLAMEDGRLRFLPTDAPNFSATLRPLGGATFGFNFDDPALAPQPLDPPFRLRIAGSSRSPVLETSYFGCLEPIT